MRLSIYAIKFIVLLFLIGALPLLADRPVVQGAHPNAPVWAPAAGPDLVITSITMTPPNAEQKVDIAVVVKNQGDAATSGIFNVYLYINPSPVPPTQATAFTTSFEYGIPLPPGGTFTLTRTDEPFPGVNAKLYAYVDPPWENGVAESNETNNLFPSDTVEPTPTPTSTPAPGDQYEEDDECQQAKPITTDGAEQQHNLFRNPGADIDWVQFQGVANVTYFIEAIADGADADMTLALRPACTLPSFGGGAKIEFLVPADGTYYVRARHKNDDYGPANAYRLKVSSNAGCTDNFEMNDACTAAGQLSLSSPQTHAFCKPNDVDWLHFPVTAGANYKVSTTNGGSNVDVKLGVSDRCNTEHPAALGNVAEFTAATSGVYYVKATNAQGTHGAGTTYVIQVQQVNAGAGDSFELDNSRERAQPITVGATTAARTFYPAGDEDWAKFTATANITYAIETVNMQASSDPILCLFDSAGVELACDDDSGAGEGARLIWRAPQAGDYFLQLKNYQRDVVGDATAYQLRVQEDACTVDSHEPDDSRATARPLATDGTRQQHNICPANDQDWVSFTANANTPYLLETTDVGAEADTLIELYDANGTLLTQNDDHTPGGASQIAYTFAQAGAYYAKVMLYNSANFGAGTEYSLRMQPGTPTPTPTTPPPPTPTATPTPQPSEAQSLILVNRAQIAALYSEAEATQLMSKLETLAAHPAVQGAIIDLHQNSTVRDAYRAWQSDLASVDKANQVAAAIRTLIRNRWQEQGDLNYLVLVGDDRALPFYRVRDLTDLYPEKTYGKADKTHPTGAALYGNTYLIDDYYADREPTAYQGHELYLPDIAVGRLVESPSDMHKVIDAFLANPVTTLAGQDAVLVSGYDFVQDMATNICTAWQTDFANAGIAACSLIGDTWPGASLRSTQLRTNQPFKIQIIAGHADHAVEGAPNNDNIQAHEIMAANGLDLSGALIYTPGCHAGLNVPPSNSLSAIDLVQAFAGKGANYIGHTGYGWGHVYDIGWSEKLLQRYTQRLLTAGQASMGQALTDAKQDYYQQGGSLDAFDEKILQTMIFYGLPMFQVVTGNATVASSGAPADNEFPDVDMLLPLVDLETPSILVPLNFSRALNNSESFALHATGQGDYYALHQSIATDAGLPVQPLHFGNVSRTMPARGTAMLTATFQTRANFNPMVAAPYNEYTGVAAASVQAAWADTQNTQAWYPPIISTVQNNGDRSTLVTQIGQYNPATRQLRVYENARVEIFYSDSTDWTPPSVLVVDGLHDAEQGRVYVKVGATDSYGIQRVIVAYLSSANSTQLQSVALTFDSTAHMWVGSFAGAADARFFVQVVDNAGNVTTAHNKGRYYAPGERTGRTLSLPTCSGTCVFLPTIAR